MNVGVVREIKTDENRVALTPSGAFALTAEGHRVLVEAGAGEGSRIPDDEYGAARAELVDTAEKVWSEADVVVKVKEPQESEFSRLRADLVLFTYLHLAAYPRVAEALCRAGTTAVAYETVQRPDGSLPLLAPMSEVAGRMAAQVGARFLERAGGGRGVLLGGIPGVEPARVVVIGGGVAGTNAAAVAAGMGADVTIFDTNAGRLRELDARFGGRVKTAMSDPLTVRRAVRSADLVVGVVLLPGARAPRVVTTEDVESMLPGSVLVDIAIDQGGCFETSRETKHSDPTYLVGEVVHYAVGNIPAAVPRTSTFGLTNVTLPYLRRLAGDGIDEAMTAIPELRGGLNTRGGDVVHPRVLASL